MTEVFIFNGQVVTDTSAFDNGDNISVLAQQTATGWTALAVLMNTDQ